MSVEFGIITSVVPPGGWHYKQVLSNGESVRIEGGSFELLISTLREFRLRHSDLCGGIKEADSEVVRSNLRDYYCKNFRQNCAGSGSFPAAQPGGIGVSNYVSPINKAADWLANLGHMQLSHVDGALAAQRAQVCAQCPQNVQWQTGCAPCNDNIQVRTQIAKGSLATPYDRNLFVCRSFGHINSVAVWLRDTHSSSTQQVPAHCWKVTENG